MSTKPKTAPDMAALAERLTQLSEGLYEAAGDMLEMGWERHSAELLSMASLSGIYGHQVKARIERIEVKND